MLLDPILPEASAFLTCACRQRMALTTHAMTTTVHADIRETDSLNVRDAGRTDSIFFSSLIALGTMKDRGGIPRVDPELVPKCLVVIRASGLRFQWLSTRCNCAIRRTARRFLSRLKKVLMVTVRLSLI